jgi:hypothetical protein
MSYLAKLSPSVGNGLGGYPEKVAVSKVSNAYVSNPCSGLSSIYEIGEKRYATKNAPFLTAEVNSGVNNAFDITENEILVATNNSNIPLRTSVILSNGSYVIFYGYYFKIFDKNNILIKTSTESFSSSNGDSGVVSVDNGDSFVVLDKVYTGTWDHRLRKFSSTGVLLSTVVVYGPQYGSPHVHIATLSDGNILVAYRHDNLSFYFKIFWFR